MRRNQQAIFTFCDYDQPAPARQQRKQYDDLKVDPHRWGSMDGEEHVCRDGIDYELVSFTLICDELTLTNRAQQRDNNLTPHFTLLAQTRNLSNTIKIETANRSPEEVVDEMLLAICDAPPITRAIVTQPTVYTNQD